MATTIREAQARILATNFLDTLGSDDFKPVETLTSLIELAALIITEGQKNLRESGNISSGALSDSLEVEEPKREIGGIVVNIDALEYFKYINSGVRGLKGGKSKENFSFKTAMPSRKMVEEIRKWLNRGNKKSKSYPKKYSVSGHEKKNTTLSEIDSAFAVGRSIKAKGIKASGFLDKAIIVAQSYAEEMLGASLVVDIQNSLPDKLNDGNSNKR